MIGPNLRVGAPHADRFGSPLGPAVSAPPVPEIPALHTSGGDPESWIRADDQSLTFRTSGQKRDVKLVPLNSIFDRWYSVY